MSLLLTPEIASCAPDSTARRNLLISILAERRGSFKFTHAELKRATGLMNIKVSICVKPFTGEFDSAADAQLTDGWGLAWGAGTHLWVAIAAQDRPALASLVRAPSFLPSADVVSSNDDCVDHWMASPCNRRTHIVDCLLAEFTNEDPGQNVKPLLRANQYCAVKADAARTITNCDVSIETFQGGAKEKYVKSSTTGQGPVDFPTAWVRLFAERKCQGAEGSVTHTYIDEMDDYRRAAQDWTQPPLAQN